jgi:SAM-dependent methyltransferase
MSLAVELQPDQKPERWNDHVAVYEEVFEPLTNAFARRALDHLDVGPGDRLIDVGAGAGGAALIAAARGGDVVAIDASPQMVARIVTRANRAAGVARRIHADIMDGMALGLPDASFDAAISVFGVILFPDADLGMREIARVLKPGGRAAIVTWTETERYELAARLLGAIAAVRGPPPPPTSLPAQLRFPDEPALRRLLADAGLIVSAIVPVEECWRMPSARWIADRIAFAPGMAAMVGALGADRTRVLDTFVAALERDQGRGEVGLSAIAHIGIGQKPTVRRQGGRGRVRVRAKRDTRAGHTGSRWRDDHTNLCARVETHSNRYRSTGDVPCRIRSLISGIS